jgi:hypothetical protein
MTPRRISFACGTLAAIGFFLVSEALRVRPGHPIAERTDVFFQSDAGGLIQDAVENRTFRARGTHPLIYPLWTWPLHAFASWLSPTIDPAMTATFASRCLVALVAGVGIGALAGALAARGLTTRRTFAFGLLATVANGHTLAAIPDHFGFSVGAIGLAFAAMLSNRSDRFKIFALSSLAPIFFGITVTNVLLPIGLLAVVILNNRRMSIHRWHIVAALTLVLVIAAAGREIGQSPSIQARVRERVSLYLNLRLVEDPIAALGYTFRGATDCAVAPTPHILRNNLDRLPMLTYETDAGPRPFWPHDGLQTGGALVWLGLLGWGVHRGWRDSATRIAAIGALGWAGGNAIFHNLWGDEYFLYSPHYTLPLLMVAAFGFRTMPSRVFYPCLAVVAGAALHSLRHYHVLLHGIAE